MSKSTSSHRKSEMPVSMFQAFTALSLATIDPDNSAASMKKSLFDSQTETAWIAIVLQDGKKETRAQTIRIFQNPDQDIMLDDGKQAYTIHNRGQKCLYDIGAWYRDKVKAFAQGV